MTVQDSVAHAPFIFAVFMVAAEHGPLGPTRARRIKTANSRPFMFRIGNELDARIVSSITSHSPGILAREIVVVSLQHAKPSGLASSHEIDELCDVH
jgi:hypothetical protein